MPPIMYASVQVGADTSRLNQDVNRIQGELESRFGAIGRSIASKAFDVTAFKSRMAEVNESIARVKRDMDFEFRMTKITGLDQAKSVLQGISHELNTIKAQTTELQRAKIDILRSTGLDARSSIAGGTQSGGPTLVGPGATQDHLNQIARLDQMLRQLGATAMEVGSRETDAMRKVVAVEKEQAAQTQKQIDLERQRLSVRTHGLEAAKAGEQGALQAQRMINAMLEQENQIVLRRGGGHMPGSPMAQGGRGGPGGGGMGLGMGRMAMTQASYGLQDIMTVGAAGGGFQQMMVGASNNLGAMFTMLGSVNGALLGLGVTAAGLALPTIFDKINKSLDGAHRGVNELERDMHALKEAGELAAAAMRFRGEAAGSAESLRLEIKDIRQKKAGTHEEQEAAKGGFRGIERSLDAELRSTRARIDELKAQAIENNPRVVELNAQIERARRQTKNKEKRWTGDATPFPEEVGSEPFTEDEVKAMKEERRNLESQEARRFQEESAQRRKRSRLERERGGIQRDVSVEQMKEHKEKMVSLENDLDRMNDSGNEFDKRRERIREHRDQLRQKIIRETEGRPQERDKLLSRLVNSADSSLVDVHDEENRDRDKFMSGLRHQAHGTGRAGAIEDEVRSRQQDIERRKRDGQLNQGQYDEATRLNLQKGQSDRVQLEHSTRNRVQPEYSGIEEYAKKLQLSVLGSDDKKIQEEIDKNTNRAAKALEEGLPDVIKAVKEINNKAK